MKLNKNVLVSLIKEVIEESLELVPGGGTKDQREQIISAWSAGDPEVVEKLDKLLYKPMSKTKKFLESKIKDQEKFGNEDIIESLKDKLKKISYEVDRVVYNLTDEQLDMFYDKPSVEESLILEDKQETRRLEKIASRLQREVPSVKRAEVSEGKIHIKQPAANPNNPELMYYVYEDFRDMNAPGIIKPYLYRVIEDEGRHSEPYEVEDGLSANDLIDFFNDNVML